MSEPLNPAVVRRPPVRIWRRALGLGIWCAGGVIALEWVWREWIRGHAQVEQALWGGLIAALATALGTLPALLAGGTSERARDGMLGFGAGVMLAASAFSLVVPALDAAQAQGASRMGASLTVGLGLALGAGVLLGLQTWVQTWVAPREEAARTQGRRTLAVWFFVLAVTLHNIPEGLAIGVGFAGDDAAGARALAAGVAIQDVPEGLVIAMALRGVGYGPALAVLVGALSGLGEPVAAVLGATVVGSWTFLLPLGLALAAGAMIFVIAHDVIPQAQQGRHARLAAVTLVGGFICMMVLDTALG